MSHQIPHDLLTRCTQHTIQCESGQGATKSDLTLFRRRDNLPENELRNVALVCHGGWSTRTKGADNLALTLVPTGSKICFFGPTGKGTGATTSRTTERRRAGKCHHISRTLITDTCSAQHEAGGAPAIPSHSQNRLCLMRWATSLIIG
jgi:hypothetical protein